jgi:MOSC domain-containing protein YiiM
MAILDSVNVGRPMASEHTSAAATGIDKRPVPGAVTVREPGAKGVGLGSGLVGDFIGDGRHHGGTEQAVYAYAREDLDEWQQRLGRPLTNGSFGENLTTRGLDVTGARLGERWQIGAHVQLQVTCPRIPCVTFRGWMDEAGWVKTFTQRGQPGAYLRIVVPGEIRAGDPIEVVHTPDHDVTIELSYRALTTQRELLPQLLAAGDDLTVDMRNAVGRDTVSRKR